MKNPLEYLCGISGFNFVNLCEVDFFNFRPQQLLATL